MILESNNNLNLQNNLEIIVEIISILKRFTGLEDLTITLVESKLFSYMLDLVENYNMILLKHFLEFLIHLIESTRLKKKKNNCFFREKEKKNMLFEQIGQLFFLGKMLMIFESHDIGFKLTILNIISKIIKHPLVNENFQKMKGFSVFFNEMKKVNNQKVKILTLHCFNELIQNPTNFFYFKAHGIVNYLEGNLRFFFSLHYLIINFFL